MNENPSKSEPPADVNGGRHSSADQEDAATPKDSTKNSIPRELREKVEEAFNRQQKVTDHARQLLRQGQLKAAEAECRRAIEMAPGGKPWIGAEEIPLLGDILLAQGRNPEALQTYLSARTSSRPDDPQNPRPNLNVALAYCRLGDFEKAKKYCPDQALLGSTNGQGLAGWPGTGDLRSLEACLLFARGIHWASRSDAEGGLPYLLAAGKLAPENWLIAQTTGVTLDRLERYDEAVPYYKIAVKYGGDKAADRAHERAKAKK